MTEKRQERIRGIVWERTARSARRALHQLLQGRVDLSAAAFLDAEETDREGSLFWTKVGQQNEQQSSDGFESCVRLLRPECWPKGQVVYFHRFTKETGALLLDVSILLQDAEDLRTVLGPDFLFMERGGAFGFCFEQAETEAVYRLWGYLCA